jgi:hypothetical protein
LRLDLGGGASFISLLWALWGWAEIPKAQSLINVGQGLISQSARNSLIMNPAHFLGQVLQISFAWNIKKSSGKAIDLRRKQTC